LNCDATSAATASSCAKSLLLLPSLLMLLPLAASPAASAAADAAVGSSGPWNQYCSSTSSRKTGAGVLASGCLLLNLPTGGDKDTHCRQHAQS
jgi:hypothetical protein